MCVLNKEQKARKYINFIKNINWYTFTFNLSAILSLFHLNIAFAIRFYAIALCYFCAFSTCLTVNDAVNCDSMFNLM